MHTCLFREARLWILTSPVIRCPGWHKLKARPSGQPSGFASAECSTGKACRVAKEGWWLKLQLKAVREIHPTPENSFEGNRVKDNFENESWDFAFHWVSGVWLVSVTVLQQWEGVTRDPTAELGSLRDRWSYWGTQVLWDAVSVVDFQVCRSLPRLLWGAGRAASLVATSGRIRPLCG